MSTKKNIHAVLLGRKGGKATSPRKEKAARLNGLKGGWKKGRKRKASDGNSSASRG